MEYNSEKQFDDFIKGSLENIQASYDPESWSLLEQRMDQMEGKEIDAAARQALTNYSVPYNPATWQLLSERLERLDYRRKLIALKVVEAALILLVLLTAVRFVRQMPASSPEQKTPDTELQQQHMAVELPQAGDFEVDADASSDLSQVKIEQKSTTAIPKDRSEFRSLEQIVQIAETINQTPALVTNEISAGEVMAERTVSNLAPLPVNIETLPEQPRATLDMLIANAEVTVRETRKMENIKGRTHAVSMPAKPILAVASPTLAGLPTIDVGVIVHEDMLISLASAAPKLRKTRSLSTKMGLYHQSSVHNISFYLAGNRKKNQTVHNPAVGFQTVVQSKRLGFDFGLAYEKLNFLSGTVDNDGNANTMEIQKVHLPVNLRFIPITNRYFDIYMKGGVTAHGVLAAYYEPPFASARGIRSEYNEKYNDGLLRKEGLLHNNSYYSVNYGVGAEVKAFENWSVFVEGMMQKHHKGELGQGQGIKISSRMLTVGINRTL